jgi:hypothetical protein
VSVTYPSSRVLNWNYGTAGAIDDVLSRVNKLMDGAADLVLYSYLGRQQIIRAQYSEPGVELTYLLQSPEGTGDAGDQYTGLDRFGRVVDQRWLKTSDGTPRERVKYGYIYFGPVNRQWRQRVVWPEELRYDGLSQLTNMDRTIAGIPFFEEDFWYTQRATGATPAPM